MLKFYIWNVKDWKFTELKKEFDFLDYKIIAPSIIIVWYNILHLLSYIKTKI